MIENNYKYRALLYHEGDIIYLSEEEIKDVNMIETTSLNTELNRLIIDYNDKWTNFYINNNNFDSFFVMLKVYDDKGNFLQQLEILSEKHEVTSEKIILYFEQSMTNKAWTSINPSWVMGITKYNEKRKAYNRVKNIESFID